MQVLGRIIKDLSGRQFGRLTAVRFDHFHVKPSGQLSNIWACKCSCGGEKMVSSNGLIQGLTRSCGCISRENPHHLTHGCARVGRHTPEYACYKSMRYRCLNKNNPAYDRYGGRGITICSRWLNSFEDFLRDMGAKPSTAHSIHRVNNDGNYEPRNCIWGTEDDQNTAKRTTRNLMTRGKTLPLFMWSRKTGILPSTITARLKRGWSVHEALSLEPDYGRRRRA